MQNVKITKSRPAGHQRALDVLLVKMSFIKSLCFCVVLMISFRAYAIETFKSRDPVQTVKEMAPGINLGNTLDAVPNEDSWGNGGTSQATIQGIKDSGFRSFRIPVTWFPHMGPAPDYKIDKQWMDRVEEIVDWSLKAGLYTVLNVHHDSWKWMQVMTIDPATGKYVNDSKTYIPRLEKLWVQIADRFKDKGDKLILEILNEPNSGTWEDKSDTPKNPRAPAVRHDLSFEEMNEITLRILKVIRASGGNNDNRLVMICPRGNSAEDAMVPEFRMPPAPYDKNLILTVHMYGPWDFVSSWWGHYTWGTEKEKKEADDYWNKLNDGFVAKGIPIVIGEWGAFGRTERFSRWYYFDYQARLCAKYNIAMMLWDTGGDYNRLTRDWRDPLIRDIIVNRANSIPNSFVLTSDAYIRAKQPLPDLVLDLELNGNRLVDIYNETTKQKLEKADYMADAAGTSVTIKKQALSKLVNQNKLGLNTVLKFDFSEGIDQPVNLVVYDTPVISKSSITLNKAKMFVASDIKIPTQFNGTKLAAARLITAAGNKNVKEPWTPYLTEGDDYDYNFTNSITLKYSILSRIKEDSKFVFEFWPKGPTAELQAKFIPENKGSLDAPNPNVKVLIKFQSDADMMYFNTKDPVKAARMQVGGRDALQIKATGISGWAQDYFNAVNLNSISGASWASAKSIDFKLYINEDSDLGSYSILVPVLQSSMNYWMPLDGVDLKNLPRNKWIPVSVPINNPDFLKAIPNMHQIMFIFNCGTPIDATFAIDDLGYSTKIE